MSPLPPARNQAWFIEAIYRQLSEHLNLSQRYILGSCSYGNRRFTRPPGPCPGSQIWGTCPKFLCSVRMNDLTPSQYPFAGRVSSVIPFLPFTPDEQAVIAHKYLLDLVTSMKQPKAIQQSQLIGAINLRFRQETALCRNLASKDYHADTGARSLEAAVKRRVRNAVVRKSLESSQVTHEENTVEDYVVDIGSQGEIVVLDT